MVPSSAGAVVMVPFPFSDLSQTKLRPAIALAGSGRGDWVLCQITSNPYADSRAVLLESRDFAVGSLRLTSSPAMPVPANFSQQTSASSPPRSAH